jgi:dephospho-CoA kinase
MKVIGITGGIGSGKSTVTQCLAQLGAVVIDADRVGWEAYMPGTEVWHEVVAEFGQQVVAENGEIDRKKLGQIIFNNPALRERLNRIMHPRMYKMMEKKIETYHEQGVQIVVLEAAVLIEANWTPLVDQLWVTVSSESVVLERLKKQRGMTEEQILSRIRSQLSIEERKKYADEVIQNDGDLEEMKEKIKALWEKLHA